MVLASNATSALHLNRTASQHAISQNPRTQPAAALEQLPGAGAEGGVHPRAGRAVAGALEAHSCAGRIHDGEFLPDELVEGDPFDDDIAPQEHR